MLAAGTIGTTTAHAAAPSAAAVPAQTNIAASGVPVLKPGQRLLSGQHLTSQNGYYKLYMQTNGNLVLYKGSTALWATRTSNHRGAFLAMQTNGNLVLYYGRTPLWSTRTGGFSVKFFAVQNDSNLVLYDTSSRAIWWRYVYSIGTLRTGAKLYPGRTVLSSNRAYRLTMQADGNLVLYRWSTALWSTQTHGKNGAVAVMQADGNFVLYLGSTAIWATNTHTATGSFIAVQNDSNVVLYTSAGKAVWDRHMIIGVVKAPYRINGGMVVVSVNRVYRLQMQTDGNLVLVKNTGAVLWATNTAPRSGVWAAMQKDGNFVLYQGTTPLWSTGTGGHAGAYLNVQDDGNVVVYQGTTPLWSTGTGGR